jgi:hypothetical protein
MFDGFIPRDPESPHAVPEGVCDDANLGNDDTSVGFPSLLPPRSPNPWVTNTECASKVTNTECESQDNAHGQGNNYLINQREAFLVKNNGGAFYMTCQHKVQTSLRAILHKFNAPMYAFDEIQKWAHESAKLVKYDFADKKLPPLASYTKSVFQRFDLHGTKPMLAPLTLPVKEREINFVVHDACQQVYSQLTNPTLMATPNLNFTNRVSLCSWRHQHWFAV